MLYPFASRGTAAIYLRSVAGVWQSLASLPVFDAESARQTFISPEVWINAAPRRWL